MLLSRKQIKTHSFKLTPYTVKDLPKEEIDFLVDFTKKVETFSDKEKLKDYLCYLFNLKKS